MPVRIVTSKQNARLKELRRALTRPGREAGVLMGIEGPHLVEEAIAAGLRIKTIFVRMDDRQITGIRDSEKHGIGEVLFIAPELFDSVVQTETPQSVAALVEPPDWTWAHILRQANAPVLVVVLAGL